MAFHVGQLVLAVGGYGKLSSSIRGHSFSRPRIGAVVTIKTIREWSSWTAVTLVEHDNSHLLAAVPCRIEPGFDARDFRPLSEDRLSIFRSMLQSPPVHEDQLERYREIAERMKRDRSLPVTPSDYAKAAREWL